MTYRKKKLITGALLIGFFALILDAIFSPLFKQKNALEFLDDLYNSISKGSAYYIPDIQKENEAFIGNFIELNIEMKNSEQAKQSALLLSGSGAEVMVNEAKIDLRGDLHKIIKNSLEDADAVYHNQLEKVSSKYNYDAKRVLYNWWTIFKEMDKKLSKEKKYKEVKIISSASKRALEPAYNYYQIEPKKVKERWGFLTFSLVFYIIYTVWYGFGILFLFEGLGIKLSH